MEKYIYFMTSQEQWLELAEDLYEKKIAKPILWLGDDRHFEKAKNTFGDDAVRMLDFVHRPYLLESIEYNGEFESFFSSSNYIRAKDLCLKMMDRLDKNLSFGRLDREAYFHNLTLWTLKRLYNSLPDVFLAVENPHSHTQYLIYEICLYLKIPTFKFNNWMPVPLMFLENMSTGNLIKKPLNQETSKYDKIIDVLIEDFVNNLILEKENAKLPHMKILKKENLKYSKIKTFIKQDIVDELKDIKHNSEFIIKPKYNPINPSRLFYITRLKIRNKRKKNLLKALKENVQKMDYNKKYVYFPLHYEPERTTNPDGGVFQDQLLAIIKLRKLVPDNIAIIVKEHPSQFIYAEPGSRGRSPLFYKLIKNIKELKFISLNENSIKLILNSEMVASVTGSVCIESAILGKKAITFGKTWYSNCPNTIKWSDDLNYNEILKSNIKNNQEILTFLKKLKNNFSFIAIQNVGKKEAFKEIINQDFYVSQRKSLLNIISNFFKEKTYLIREDK